MNSKIQQILKLTKTIIHDCSLENGGIVAANSTKKYFIQKRRGVIRNYNKLDEAKQMMDLL